MTRLPLPPPAGPEDGDALHALYREASQAEPGPALDAAILAAARADLKAAQTSAVARSSTWWRRWLPATSAVAVAVLGVSVALRMLHDDEARQAAMLGTVESEVPSTAMDEASGAPAIAPEPAAPTVAADSAANQAGMAKKQRAEAPAARSLPVLPARQKALSADAVKRERMSEAESAPALSAAPPALAAPVAAPMVSESAAQNPAPSVLAPQAKSAEMAADRTADPENTAALEATADPTTPQAWIAHLRQLQTDGRIAEARQSLARFRSRFPNEVVPDDLAGLK